MRAWRAWAIHVGSLGIDDDAVDAQVHAVGRSALGGGRLGDVRRVGVVARHEGDVTEADDAGGRHRRRVAALPAASLAVAGSPATTDGCVRRKAHSKIVQRLRTEAIGPPELDIGGVGRRADRDVALARSQADRGARDRAP